MQLTMEVLTERQLVMSEIVTPLELIKQRTSRQRSRTRTTWPYLRCQKYLPVHWRTRIKWYVRGYKHTMRLRSTLRHGMLFFKHGNPKVSLGFIEGECKCSFLTIPFLVYLKCHVPTLTISTWPAKNPRPRPSPFIQTIGAVGWRWDMS